ncbi:hypothetical protein SNEBB_005475 [Seison nebaliae]|nr:hypothetical protein SNEBB_005475 [Seison nebaliae]
MVSHGIDIHQIYQLIDETFDKIKIIAHRKNESDKTESRLKHPTKFIRGLFNKKQKITFQSLEELIGLFEEEYEAIKKETIEFPDEKIFLYFKQFRLPKLEEKFPNIDINVRRSPVRALDIQYKDDVEIKPKEFNLLLQIIQGTIYDLTMNLEDKQMTSSIAKYREKNEGFLENCGILPRSDNSSFLVRKDCGELLTILESNSTFEDGNVCGNTGLCLNTVEQVNMDSTPNVSIPLDSFNEHY